MKIGLYLGIIFAGRIIMRNSKRLRQLNLTAQID